ncbi:SDR family oxidoreductase [Hydrocarboniphaga sp.]|uniref:SDR family oxidoreductase n=1 Tax=Hydrocarboniphaga sp. TaxID=2033016 RepID=UPI003D120E18
MKRLASKVALIIGAAGKDNMGQVIARRLHSEGAAIIVAGRQLEPLQQFAEQVGGLALQCDITRRGDIVDAAQRAFDWKGRLDIGINATGWGFLKNFLETTEDELQRITALQFTGPFHFYQSMIEAMMKNPQPGGSIIQISSATATIMLNDHAAYMGTKAGSDHIIRCIAHEYGKHGIRANSISPGLTDTPMNAEAKKIPGMFDSFIAGYPLGRIGTSDDVAAAAAWLCSDECFMTGENLQVNGGLTLRRNPTREEIGASIAAAAAARA